MVTWLGSLPFHSPGWGWNPRSGRVTGHPGCDGAQVWLSWTEAGVSAAASQLARGQVPATHPLGAQGGDPESLWPVLALGGYFPSKLSLSQGRPSQSCALCHSPEPRLQPT